MTRKKELVLETTTIQEANNWNHCSIEGNEKNPGNKTNGANAKKINIYIYIHHNHKKK